MGLKCIHFTTILNYKFVGVLKLIFNSDVYLMMEEPRSYYDWKARFKQKKVQRKMKRTNSLGIYTHEFGEFLENWKKKNLPIKGKSRKISF